MNMLKKVSPLVLGLVCSTVALSMGASEAQALSISSTVNQSNYQGFSTDLFPLTATPYDFAGQSFNLLSSIANLSVKLTLNDADTAPSDFDFDRITLGLDGIDTGIKLNGFGDNQLITATISGVPNNAASILAALKADGQLIGTLIGASPNGNSIGIPGGFQTQLSLSDQSTAIPTPALLPGLIGLGVAALRKRKAEAAEQANEA